MAQARDIRRDVAAPTPNTFVYQPVVDTSLAEAAKNLTGIGLKLDADLAQERFKEASEMLNAQYVVGSPAAGALLSDSPSDNVKLSPEDDRSLRDFQEVLNTNQLARDQGRMNYQSYQLRQERLLRIAIAKRPGLASEFRNIATAYVGSDVTGAEARFLAEQERQMAQDAAAQAKAQQDQREKWHESMREMLIEAGVFEAALVQGPDDPLTAQVFGNPANLEKLRRFTELAGERKVAEAAAAIGGAQRESALTNNTIAFQQNAMQRLGRMDDFGVMLIKQMQDQGLGEDANYARQAIRTMINNAEAERSQMIVEATANGIPQSAIDLENKRIDAKIAHWTGIADMSDDKEFFANLRAAQQTQAQLTALRDPNLRQFLANIEVFPPEVRTMVMQNFEPEAMIYINRLITDASMPDDLVIRGPALLPQMASVIRNSKTGKVVPQSLDMYVQVAAQTAQAFGIAPDSTPVRFASFTKDPRTGKLGVVALLREQFPILGESMSTEQKNEIYSSIGMGYANSVRRAIIAIRQKDPQLAGMIQPNGDFQNGNAFQFRPGASAEALSPAQAALLRQYNAELQPKLVAETMGMYGGVPANQVALDTWQRLFPEAKKRREGSGASSGARAGAGSRGSSASPARAVKGTGEFSGFSIELVED